MISHRSDLLLFDQSINYHSKAEVWLLKTEYCAQETIGKLIGHAVSSFPKQPLDEWIIDYPQQTILSTIHLILTHEINEMLHELKAAKTSEAPSMTQSGVTEMEGMMGDSSQLHTRSIPQLQDTSRMTSKLDDSVRPEPNMKDEQVATDTNKDKIEEAKDGEEESEGKTQEAKTSRSGKYSSPLDVGTNKAEAAGQQAAKEEDKKQESKAPGGRLTQARKQEEEAKARELELQIKEEKQQYVVDMFGPDFDRQALDGDLSNIEALKISAFKDVTMKALQEKSFQGLYLRLQFWINQIYKRLHGKSGECYFKLDKTHTMVMKTIICFLSYMRDVVLDLRLKGINDYESYEWQKQIRLTWNASEPGCKVECGGWASYQGNEYLGSKIRLPITPLTNRYFVF